MLLNWLLSCKIAHPSMRTPRQYAGGLCRQLQLLRLGVRHVDYDWILASFPSTRCTRCTRSAQKKRTRSSNNMCPQNDIYYADPWTLAALRRCAACMCLFFCAGDCIRRARDAVATAAFCFLAGTAEYEVCCWALQAPISVGWGYPLRRSARLPSSAMRPMAFSTCESWRCRAWASATVLSCRLHWRASRSLMCMSRARCGWTHASAHQPAHN